MGEVNHLGTFLRSTLVKDPCSLGDFMQPQDVLRIEAEFPQLFRKQPVLGSRSDSIALKHKKPADGSPYKSPVVSNLDSKEKSFKPPTKNEHVQKRAQAGFSRCCSRGSRCLPENFKNQTLMPGKLCPSRSAPVRKNETKIATDSNSNAKNLNPNSTNEEITQNRLTVNVWKSAKHQQLDGKSEFAVMPKLPPSPRLSSPKLKKKESRGVAKQESRSSSVLPSRAKLKAEEAWNADAPSQNLKCTHQTRRTPGFIRPVFAEKRYRLRSRSAHQLPHSPENKECNNFVVLRHNSAKYEELYEQLLNPCEKNSETATGKFAYRKKENHAEIEPNLYPVEQEIATADTISGKEQLKLTELLASKYDQAGKFARKGTEVWKEMKNVGTEMMDLITILNPGWNLTPYQITEREMRFLENLARQLIHTEIEGCIHRNEYKENAASTQTDDALIFKCETPELESYTGKGKGTADVSTGSNPIIANEDKPSNGSVFEHKSGSLDRTPSHVIKVDAVVQVDGHHFHGLCTPSNVESTSPGFHADLTQKCIENEPIQTKINETQSMGLKKQEETPSILVKDFARLSTIIEEVINSVQSNEVSEYFGSESRSNSKTGDMFWDKEMLEISEQKSRNTSFGGNNDITDCSSITDYVLSEIGKSALNEKDLEEPKALDSILNADKSLSLRSKVENFFTHQTEFRGPFPKGFVDQSISLLRVSMRDADSIDISGHSSHPALSSAKSVSEAKGVSSFFNESLNSDSGGPSSFLHICTNLLSHGELQVDQEKSTGEISWVNSPGLQFCISESDSD